MTAIARHLCFGLAAASFALAAVIDRPWHDIQPDEKLYGNFCCSLGFACLTLALWL